VGKGKEKAKNGVITSNFRKLICKRMRKINKFSLSSHYSQCLPIKNDIDLR